jgi:hypothetical protein
LSFRLTRFDRDAGDWVLFFALIDAHLPNVENNLASVEWLPGSASDISYYQTEGFGWTKIYECTMEEDPVREFAAGNRWVLEEKEYAFMSGRNLLGLSPLKEPDNDETDFAGKILFYEDRASNGGGITVIYDRDRKRLFVNESHR